MSPHRPHRTDGAGSGPTMPGDVGVVREEEVESGVPVRVHPTWRADFPWLVQGVTWRGRGAEPFDMALFGGNTSAAVLARWEGLRAALGVHSVLHGRQVHDATVRLHRDVAEGLSVVPDTDGHATRTRGTLLTVATADCVPVTLVVPRIRVVALLHGGWRGTAEGLLEAGLSLLRDRLACEPRETHLHLGPAICGACYEVGPEVHEALGLRRPPRPTPVDLRAVLARRASEAGVPPRQITVSAWCTRCGGSPFFSHRGGDHERQVAFAGVSG